MNTYRTLKDQAHAAYYVAYRAVYQAWGGNESLRYAAAVRAGDAAKLAVMRTFRFI